MSTQAHPCCDVLLGEVWEPIIAYLFSVTDARDGSRLVREAWSFDMQSHGEAATYNRDVLRHAELSASRLPYPSPPLSRSTFSNRVSQP